MDPASLSLDELGERLRANFPNAGPITPIGILGSGFRSVAVETEEGWVFRVARNPFAYDGQLREFELLPMLAGKLPAAVPEPQWYAGRCYDFPYGTIAYPKLPGTTLDPSSLSPGNLEHAATDIGTFLASLHGLDLNSAAYPYSPSPRISYGSMAKASLVIESLEGHLPEDQIHTSVSWWNLLDQSMRNTTFTPALRHGDLWYENILVDSESGHVTGVVDFEEAGIGDPAQDFATQLHAGYEFTTRALISYRQAGGMVDQAFLGRMRRLWATREFDGLAFALQTGNQEELQDSINKIKCGPILDPEPHREAFRQLEMAVLKP